MVLATRALLVLAVIGTVASVVCMRHQYYVFVLHDGGLTRGRSNLDSGYIARNLDRRSNNLAGSNERDSRKEGGTELHLGEAF